MNLSPLLLLGVGGAGATLLRDVSRAYGPGLRALTVDTDAASGTDSDLPFRLVGGNRLAGHGAGGNPAAARAAFQDDPNCLDADLEGVRTAVVLLGLGGGSGGGMGGEIVRHLADAGIATLVFATTPFAFEGPQRAETARADLELIAKNADVAVELPLDKVVGDCTELKAGLARATDTIATGVTLFWRVLEKPGYVRFDAERLRAALTGAGKAAFAVASATGPYRAADALALIANNGAFADALHDAPARTVVCGVLAGDDLRLAELDEISRTLRQRHGNDATFEIGTVNDEATFSGRLALVVFVLGENPATAGRAARKLEQAARNNPLGGFVSRFQNTEKTLWHGEDLDIPTFVRRNLTLDR